MQNLKRKRRKLQLRSSPTVASKPHPKRVKPQKEPLSGRLRMIRIVSERTLTSHFDLDRM
jgi:hypothetical protein